jgi:primosomal protein N''
MKMDTIAPIENLLADLFSLSKRAIRRKVRKTPPTKPKIAPKKKKKIRIKVWKAIITP